MEQVSGDSSGPDDSDIGTIVPLTLCLSMYLLPHSAFLTIPDGPVKLIEPIAKASRITADHSNIHVSQHVSNNDLHHSSRMEQIMQKFCRALWTVLKEYKEKLVVMLVYLFKLKSTL